MKTEFFKMDESVLPDIRFIHLEKKAEKATFSNEYDKDNNKIYFPNDMIGFYSFGFFDSVKCIRPLDSSCLFNFKHHFAVSYPYNTDKNIKKVEQWFGLIPLNLKYQWGKIEPNASNDIFFYKEISKQSEMPFLGIILISLNCYNDKGTPFNSFNNELERYSDLINEDIKKNKKLGNCFAGRLYLTLNCADLCIAVRTNDIKTIHILNHQLQETAVNKKFNVNTTVMFMAQVTGITNFEKIYKCNTQRNDIEFIIRSNKEYFIDKKSISKEVNGNGRYVTKLTYDQYMELFFSICKNCINDLIDSGAIGVAIPDDKLKYVSSICHEREWFDDSNCSASLSNSINKNEENSNNGIIIKSHKKIYEKIEDVKKIAKENMPFYYSSFFDSMRLVYELLDTYSDLWYQYTSPNGYIFYSQLYIALNGIHGKINRLREIEDKKLKMDYCKEIVKVLRNIIVDINGYNKQMQFLNQDAVYYPSYEIQSKVNAEKYVMAYCSFLHLIFAKYYYQPDSNIFENENDISYQNFPIVFLDIGSPDLETTFFFTPEFVDKLSRNDKQEMRRLVSVHFPSYSYFSDIWTVVPLLTHEVCHNHHYGHTEDRNKTVINYIRKVISKFFALKLLSASNSGFIDNSNTPLVRMIEKIFNDSLKEMWDKTFNQPNAVDYKTLRHDRLVEVIKKFYIDIFANKEGGECIPSYSNIHQFQEKAKNKLNCILEIFDFTVLPKFTNKNIIPTNKIIFKCWLSAMSCIINYKKGKNHQIMDDVQSYIGNINKTNIENDIYNDLYNITCEFISIYNKMKNLSENGNSAYYKDINFKSTQYLLQLGAYILADKFTKAFADNCELAEDEKKRICDLLYGKFTYNITTSIELYYDDCFETLNTLCDIFKNFELEKNNLKSINYLLEQCIEQYIELSKSACYIKEFIDFIISAEPLGANLDDDIDEFSKIFHGIGKKEITSIINLNIFEKNKYNAVSIFEKSSRENLMPLGFFASTNEITKKALIGMIDKINEEKLVHFISEKIGIYKEIYADCGMCCAMDFTAFGYMMFCVHIHVNMSQKSNLSIDETNALIERIKGISYTFFSSDNPKCKKEKNNFKQKLFNFEIIEDIINFLNSTYNNVDLTSEWNFLTKLKNDNILNIDISENMFTEYIRKLKDHVFEPLLNCLKEKILCMLPNNYVEEIKGDRVKLYKCKQLTDFVCSYLECMNFLSECLYKGNILAVSCRYSVFENYFIELKNKMKTSDWIKHIKKYDIIKEISDYYNNKIEKKSNTFLETIFNKYSNGLISHYKFIFEFYCMYRSAYGYVISSKDSEPVSSWLKLLDDYYIGRK